MIKKMTAIDFELLTVVVFSYDPFTDYIEDYNQCKAAEKHNAKLVDGFNNVFAKYGMEVEFPFWVSNEPMEEVEAYMMELVNKHGIMVDTKEQVEEEPKAAKRIWTEEEIKSLVQTNDKVLYGALKNLYACQTADEQDCSTTTHANGAGFNAMDAEFLTSVSKFLLKNGFLTDKQKAATRRKLVKYNKQLTRLANA